LTEHAPSIQDVAAPHREWIFTLARAVIAAVAALVITFTTGHDARLGLLVFAGFALATGLLLVVRTWRGRARGIERVLLVARLAVSVVAGAAALVAASGDSAALVEFLLLVTGWAVVTGMLEFYAGFRTRPRGLVERDALVVGVLGVLLAIVFLIVPPDFQQSFRSPEGGNGVVTSQVVLVGVLGAYFAIVAVYLGIGAFSLKWAKAADAATDTDSERSSS